MDPNQLRDTLISLPAVTEEQPFGPDVIVYKVLEKSKRRIKSLNELR